MQILRWLMLLCVQDLIWCKVNSHRRKINRKNRKEMSTDKKTKAFRTIRPRGFVFTTRIIYTNIWPFINVCLYPPCRYYLNYNNYCVRYIIRLLFIRCCFVYLYICTGINRIALVNWWGTYCIYPWKSNSIFYVSTYSYPAPVKFNNIVWGLDIILQRRQNEYKIPGIW